ncbi:phage terminase small subunit P27 family [Hymenobacter setariae]|uniref:Phage terminase small subunit P27 family n=1 Tax=Hymenobacter setariae TaxID=2594794 RepID=A0A558BSY6_9BACT|nr:phage terminase small subunit P27 family [Hymenobacter setariae]TVT39624.1 phage terminase small subunit P27 family [Hymenobacter setariae]
MAGGRPPKPTSQKKLGGTLQPCRTNPNEPQPEVYLPVPPNWLSERAKEYWAEIGAVLLAMKLSTVADGPALQLLTEALAEWAEAREFVQREGFTYSTFTKQGDEMHRPYPQVAIASDAWRRSMTMLTQFGLTPASRSKVSALGGDEEKNPFAEMMDDLKS